MATITRFQTNMSGQQRWLEVQADPGTCNYTLSPCIALADLQANGDYKLIIADIGGSQNVLKVLKGTSIISETTLPELPAALVAVHNETRHPRCPIIAVASGPSVYLYRNMKPYYKYSLPALQINALELDLWLQARDASIDAKRLHEMILGLQGDIGFGKLSQQSQALLSLQVGNEKEIRDFVLLKAPNPLTRKTVITCMTTLSKYKDDEDGISCLVIGSEDGAVTFVDTEAFTVIEKVEQFEEHGPRTIPAIIQTSGLLDVEYRVVVCNRDGRITLLRRGWTHSKLLVQLSSVPVDMAMLDHSQIVIVSGSVMECYSKKGKRQWEQPLKGQALGLAKVFLEHQGLTLVAVAIKGGEVHLYNGRQLVDNIYASDSVTAMVFGKFGQEDHCLILISAGGTVLVKLLKRTAQFTAVEGPSATQILQKLAIPKRTKLIVEQVARERDNVQEMHQSFQKGIFRLRLQAARELAASIQRSSNLISTDDKLPIKMNAQVFGLGPTFKIRLSLDNMASTVDYALPTMRIFMHYNHTLYSVRPPYIQVPYLVPGLTYYLDAMVTSLGDVLIAEDILVVLATENSTKPILSTAVHIPVCDVLPIEI